MNASNTMGKPVAAGSIKVTYTGTAGTTAAIPATATCIRVMATTDCFIELTLQGTAAVADTGMYLPAFSPEYFTCLGATKVSAIQVSAGGTIYVTPML